MSRLYSSRKRKLSFAAVIALALCAAVGAWAYYLAQGAGSASATAGTSPVAIQVSGTVGGSPIYPGQSRSVALDIYNDAGKGSLSDSGTITGAVATDTNGDVNGFPGCSASWFSFADVPVAGTVLAEGAHDTAQSGTLNFIESGTDQSACSGAAISLHLSLNGG